MTPLERGYHHLVNDCPVCGSRLIILFEHKLGAITLTNEKWYIQCDNARCYFEDPANFIELNDLPAHYQLADQI